MVVALAPNGHGDTHRRNACGIDPGVIGNGEDDGERRGCAQVML